MRSSKWFELPWSTKDKTTPNPEHAAKLAEARSRPGVVQTTGS